MVNQYLWFWWLWPWWNWSKWSAIVVLNGSRKAIDHSRKSWYALNWVCLQQWILTSSWLWLQNLVTSTFEPADQMLSCFYMLLSLNSSRLHIRFFSTSQVQDLLVTSLLFAGLLNLRFDQRLMASHLSRSHDDDAPHRSTHPVIWP